MAKTIAIVLAMTLMSIAPSAAFAQTNASKTDPASISPSAIWFLFVALAAGSGIVLLMATNSLQKPTSFASLPIYLFFALTIFVVFFILSISSIPPSLFGEGFPISTTDSFPASQNQAAQWVLNIGGIPNTTPPSGLQIPIYVIIAGILGAYIRYLYIGISEFKESFQQKLNSFEESIQFFFRALDDYNTHTGKTIAPWPPWVIPSIIAALLTYNIAKVAGTVKNWKDYAEEFEEEVTHLDDDPPPGKEGEKWPEEVVSIDTNTTDRRPIAPSEDLPKVRTVAWLTYKEKRRVLWGKIREAETNFKKHRFTVRLEITTHILKTVGSFFLGPLLAVLAWLLLSISGTNGSELNGMLTFALVSFAIGLTTKTIITRVMNFVGEKITEESPSATPAYTSTMHVPSVFVDPKQARAGQLLIVRGSGFRANSRITLQYDGNGGIDNAIQAVQSSSTGTFGFEFWLPSSLPAGNYNLSAEDEDKKSAKEVFTVYS
jgi:hypothetical protein